MEKYRYFYAVKFPSIILTLIVLVLSIAPCCIWENSIETIGNYEMSEEQHEDECTNCSPFYSCGNCTASLEIPSRLIPITQTSIALPPFNGELLLSFSEGVDTSIWQPPKES